MCKKKNIIVSKLNRLNLSNENKDFITSRKLRENEKQKKEKNVSNSMIQRTRTIADRTDYYPYFDSVTNLHLSPDRPRKTRQP